MVRAIAKHTPGRFVATKGIDDEPDRWQVVVDGPRQWIVATIENGAPGDTLETEGANARLFAAAPELLAACQMGAGALESVIRHNDGPAAWPNLQKIVDAMRDAIARAEG